MLDTAVPIGHKCAHGIAIRTDDFKPAAADRDLCASLIFEDTQSGFILDGWAVSVIAIRRQTHGHSWVGIYHIVLKISILICFLTDRIKHSIFIDIRTEGELDAAGFALHTFQRIQNLEFAGIAIPVASVLSAVMSLLFISTMRVPFGTSSGLVNDTLTV